MKCPRAGLARRVPSEAFSARLTDVKFTGINVIRGQGNGSLAATAGMSLFEKAGRLSIAKAPLASARQKHVSHYIRGLCV